jgi:hypothetical protein
MRQSIKAKIRAEAIMTDRWTDLRTKLMSDYPETNLSAVQKMIAVVRVERVRERRDAIKAKQAELAMILERRRQAPSILELLTGGERKTG